MSDGQHKPPPTQKLVKKIDSEIKKMELPSELGDLSSIMKSGVNDSTQNDFQHSLDIAPSKPTQQDSGKGSHKVVPNNEQIDPVYQKNRVTNKYEKIEKKVSQQ